MIKKNKLNLGSIDNKQPKYYNGPKIKNRKNKLKDNNFKHR